MSKTIILHHAPKLCWLLNMKENFPLLIAAANRLSVSTKSRMDFICWEFIKTFLFTIFDQKTLLCKKSATLVFLTSKAQRIFVLKFVICFHWIFETRNVKRVGEGGHADRTGRGQKQGPDDEKKREERGSENFSSNREQNSYISKVHWTDQIRLIKNHDE